jgi:hypothetical protein
MSVVECGYLELQNPSSQFQNNFPKNNLKFQRAYAVRSKLAALDLSDRDIAEAVAWIRELPARPDEGYCHI